MSSSRTGTIRPSWDPTAVSGMTVISQTEFSALGMLPNTQHDQSASLRRQLPTCGGSINRLDGVSLISESGYITPCGSTSTIYGWLMRLWSQASFHFSSSPLRSNSSTKEGCGIFFYFYSSCRQWHWSSHHSPAASEVTLSWCSCRSILYCTCQACCQPKCLQ